MCKETELSGIMTTLNDLQLAEDQAIYGVGLSMKTREWDFVVKYGKKLVEIEEKRADLKERAKQIRVEIEDEAKEIIL